MKILLFVGLFLPLFGGLLFYRFRWKFVPILGVFIPLILNIYVLIRQSEYVIRFTWFQDFELGLRLDNLGLLLSGLVLFISGLVHIYSIGYISKKSQPRYFMKLGGFTSAMLGLLWADHLILLFVFWELVGFCSYLLIGFDFEDTESAKSAKWAFITNRLADVALLASILWIGQNGSFFLSELSSIESVWVGAGLLIGAMGKSAQFPFSGWLPRAMTGPTPVSALIHAATMVVAGVYILIRVGEYMPDFVMTATTVVGVLTAVFGASVAITQHEIKKVLAYSTISQLGFMFLAIGTGAYNYAFFHIWTHAFFKAGLFLSAGIFIMYMSTQDLRFATASVRGKSTIFFANVLCGLALAGLPLFSGFMSKEGILASALTQSRDWVAAGFSEGYLLFYFALIATAMTTIYVGRYLLILHSVQGRNNGKNTVSLWLSLPVLLLALMSTWPIHGLNPFGQGWPMQLSGLTMISTSADPILYTAGALVVGIVIVFAIYLPGRPYMLNYSSSTVPGSMVGKAAFYGWGLDFIYARVVSPGFLWISKIASRTDQLINKYFVDLGGVLVVVIAKLASALDKFLVDGFVRFVSWFVSFVGLRSARLQSGQIQVQLIWLIVGLLLILFWIVF